MDLKRRLTRGFRVVLIVTTMLSLGGCGGGISAVAGLILNDDGSSGDSATTVIGLMADQTKVSPARISFVLSNPRGGRSSVELLFKDPRERNALWLPMELVESGEIDTNLSGLEATSVGMQHCKLWDFAAVGQLGGNGFLGNVEIAVRLGGRDVESGPIGFGNDPPEIVTEEDCVATIEFPSGSDGETQQDEVCVGFTVKDSTNDDVRVLVQYATIDDERRSGSSEGDLKFLTASGDPMPVVKACSEGTAVRFCWDTVKDLGRSQTRVVMRLIPEDREGDEVVSRGKAVLSKSFEVDNNRAPTVEIGGVGAGDFRRGIALSAKVHDQEGDEVFLLWQWTRFGVPFPRIEAQDFETLRSCLRDPDFRREKQVCSEVVRFTGGRIEPVGERRVRLPELATTASFLVGVDDELRAEVRGTLEILRGPAAPERVDTRWSSGSELNQPISVLPVENGIEALVLEKQGDSWRLRKVDLATGVGGVLVDGSGVPTAMAWSFEGKKLLIATIGSDGRNVLFRVDRDESTVEQLITWEGKTGCRVRGIASVGSGLSVVTCGRSVLKVHHPEADEKSVVDLFGSGSERFDSPWGIVVDPSEPNSVLVTERDAHRVVRIRLDSAAVEPIVHPGGDVDLPYPEAIALERQGTRLLVLTDTDRNDGFKELRALELGVAPDLDGDGRGESQCFIIGEGYPDSTYSVASGPDQLRVLASLQNALFVGGGVLQRRKICGKENEELLSRQLVRVDGAFDPALVSPLDWRIASPGGREFLQGKGEREGVFVWNSADAPTAEEVAIRAIPFDVDRGNEDRVDRIALTPPLVGAEISLRESGGPVALVVADADGDGDRDVVTANRLSDDLTLYEQIGKGRFRGRRLRGPDGLLVNPVSVAIGDVNGDEIPDLVCANYGSGGRGAVCVAEGTNCGSLTVFFASAAGEFEEKALSLAGDQVAQPVSVVTADVNGDSRQDLVCANEGNDSLVIFLQGEEGGFGGKPILVRDAEGRRPSSLAVADLNGDGKVDLISAYRDSDNVVVFYQGGEMSFSSAVLALPVGVLDPTGIAIGDVDRNGLLDIVTAHNRGGDLSILWQETPGIFMPRAVTEAGRPRLSEGPRTVALGDLDQDGDLDLVAGNADLHSVTAYYQQEPKVFQPLELGAFDAKEFDFPVAVAVADLEGDGDSDIVSANRFSSTVTLFLQTGAGEFSSVPTFDFGFVDEVGAPDSLTVGHLQGRERLDVVTANSDGSELRVFKGRISGFDEIALVLPSTFEAPTSSANGDFDGDGDQDIVSANRGSDDLALFYQNGRGDFSEVVPIPPPENEQQRKPRVVQTSDLDGDGDLDLVSANFKSDNVSLYRRNEKGGYDVEVLGGGMETEGGRKMRGPTGLAISDLDGDGDLDIVTANAKSDNLTVFEQREDGLFTVRELECFSCGFGSPVSVFVDDLDEDGDQDVAVASALSDELSVFFMERPWEYRRPPLILNDPGTTDRPVTVVAADVDSDGDLDLLSANARSDSISIFEQLSPGVFDPRPTRIATARRTMRPQDIAVVDVNGDGDVDIVTSNWGSRNLTFFFGSAGGQ